MSAEVIKLGVFNFRKPADMLRRLADEIEAGTHGEEPELAIAMLGRDFGVYGAGPNQDGASAALLLQAGVQRLATMIEQYKEGK